MKWQFLIIKNLFSPTTDGSRSMKTALGTCLPPGVSEKKVLKESSDSVAGSSGINPSG